MLDFEVLKQALDQVGFLATIDSEGCLTYINSYFCNELGLIATDLIGKHISIMGFSEYFSDPQSEVWTLMKNSRPWSGNLNLNLNSGSTIHIKVFLVPLVAVNIKSPQFAFLGVKTCDEKSLRYQEVTKEQFNLDRLVAVGEMVSVIIHEIKNPLTAINLRAQMMRKYSDHNGLSKDLTLKISDNIVKAVAQIEKIIKSVRGYVRSGEDDPFDAVYLKSIIDEILEFTKPRFTQSGVEIFLNNFVTDLKIKCRPYQISQVLINLLNNSFDSIQKLNTKWIKITVSDGGDRVFISVEDSGHGIPEEHRKKIMEPFFTTKGASEGAGLGLSISKGIMELHGGSLKCDDTQKHTTFIMEIPKLRGL